MVRDLWRWTRGLLATSLWSFVMVGLLGMAEGLSQWLRFDVLQEGGPGFVRAVASTVTLYGWLAMVVAAFLYTVFYLLVRRRPHPRRQAYAYTVSTIFGLFFFFYTGYLGREHLAPDWWAAHEAGLALALQGLVMISVSVLLAKPVLTLASRQVLNPWRNTFLAVAFVVVFTSLWPNWREEGRARRLVGLPAAPTAVQGPNVVLVTIDTLRRDMISALDSDAPPTPGLDALADEGLLFTNMWSTSSWTLPSMASLMTGYAPRALGVAKYRGLPADAATLAQAAHNAGWYTAAVAANPYLTPDYGFDRGFDDFEHAQILEPLQPAARSVLARELDRLATERLDLDDARIMVDKAVRWLDRSRGDRPFFLWVHLMEPHVPYRWRELPVDAPAPRRGVPADRSLVPDDPLFPGGEFPGANLPRVREALPGLSPEVRVGLRTLYRQEVRYADACLARLWATLRARGVWDETLVMVTADHGEEFFEHGGFEHGHSLMPEITGVPLIVRLPGGEHGGLRIDTDWTLADLTPSLCVRLGWIPPPGLDGDPGLFDAPDGVGRATGPPDVMENMLYGPPREAVRAWPLLGVGPAADAPRAWYDLSVDPGALTPLAAPPATADTLLAGARARQARWDAQAAGFTEPELQEVDIDEVLRRRLRSLGY